jgi:hypothetical protein
MNIPSLVGATEKRGAAYEVKFVVSASAAEAALSWARSHLSPDPHVAASDVDGYRVNSLYFDTPALDVYQRNGSYGKAKYRVRRYGEEETVFLERKLKSRGLVSKRRTRIPDVDILLLAASESLPDWIGYWFRRRLVARKLLPQCQIRYQRTARVGASSDGPVRLTLDREILSFPTKDYHVREDGEWMPLLGDRCILELKFQTEMPPLFKGLMEQLSLTPQAVSKYRLSIQAHGLEPKPKTTDGTVAGNGHATQPMVVMANHQSIPLETAGPKGEA